MNLNSIKNLVPHIHRHKGGIMQPAEHVFELGIPTGSDGTGNCVPPKEQSSLTKPKA
jgi:hypothetical protein